MSLQPKNYIVIGGASGIGKELSIQLADEGHSVWATYHETPVFDHANIEFHHLDVTEDELDLSFAPDEVHGVAYCPGNIKLVPFHRIKPEMFQADFNLQVLGAVKTLQALLPNMKKAEMASVVMFSTVAVKMGFPFHAMVASSKAALEGLAKSLAAEWAPKIRVNAVAPSLTDTPLASGLLNSEEKKKANAERHPLKSIGNPEDMANAAMYLLTDRSKWMTGQVLHVDGGMSGVKI